jgi:hypothetical protein
MTISIDRNTATDRDAVDDTHPGTHLEPTTDI